MADSPITAQDVKAIVAEREIRFIRFWFTDVLGQLKSFSINAAELDGALEARHGLRRLLDHRLQRDRGVRHDRDARPGDIRGAALAPGGAGRRADVLRHPDARAHALRGRPAPHPAPRGQARAPTWASTPSTSAPSSSTSSSATATGTEPLDTGGYFDLTTLDAGSDVRRETSIALEAARHPRRVQPPRGRPVPARDRHPLRRRAEDGRRLHDLPDHGQGGRAQVRLARDLHAEAAVRRERLGHAHPPVAVRRRHATPSSTPTTTTSSRRSARRSSPASCATRARSARSSPSGSTPTSGSCPATRRRSTSPGRGATARRSSACRSTTPAREEATRMELRCPDPACNPYLTFAALLQAGLEGIEKGYELPEPMEKNLYHLAPEERRRLGIEQLPETLGAAIELTADSELALRTLGEHTFNRYIEIKRREWEEYRDAGDALGARPLPADPVSARRHDQRLATSCVDRLGFGAMRITGPGIWGPPADPRRRGRESAAPRRRARRQLHRHRRRLRPRRQRGADRHRARPLRRAGHRDQGRADAVRARRAGLPTGGPSTCARHSRAACGVCGSTRSTSTSSTAPTRRCRSRSRSACSSKRSAPARSATSASPTSPRAARAGARDDRRSSRCRTATARSIASQPGGSRCVHASTSIAFTAVGAAGGQRGHRRTPAALLAAIAARPRATHRQIALAWLLAASRR